MRNAYHDKLLAYIADHHIACNHLLFEQSTHSVAEAAEAAGVTPQDFIKSICMITKDGRVMLLRRDRARELAPEPTEIPNRSPVHDSIVEHLRTAGASFLVAIEQAAGGAGRAAVTAALWDLVWAGVVTNDTFAPLRSLATPNTRRICSASRNSATSTPGS